VFITFEFLCVFFIHCLTKAKGKVCEDWLDPVVAGGCCCAWLLLHSPSDAWVREEQSRGWQSELKRNNKQCSLEVEERGKHFAMVRDDAQEMKRLAERTQRAMRGVEVSVEGRDEQRKLAKTGYREGRVSGSEAAAQRRFGEGFAEGAKQGTELGKKLGEWHTREQLSGREEARKDDLIEIMEENRQLTQEEMNKFLK
jgi:hypothetical protein